MYNRFLKLAIEATQADRNLVLTQKSLCFDFFRAVPCLILIFWFLPVVCRVWLIWRRGKLVDWPQICLPPHFTSTASDCLIGLDLLPSVIPLFSFSHNKVLTAQLMVSQYIGPWDSLQCLQLSINYVLTTSWHIFLFCLTQCEMYLLLALAGQLGMISR